MENSQSIARLQSAIGNVAAKRESLSSAKSLDELRMAWSDFLVYHHRFFTVLRQVCDNRRHKSWWQDVIRVRKIDPLLRYIHHARNSDEHGLIEVVRDEPGGFSIGSGANRTVIENIQIIDGKLVSANVREGVAIINRIDDRITLVDVADRGVVYSVPDEHLGQDLDKKVEVIADLAFKFIDDKFVEFKNRAAASSPFR